MLCGGEVATRENSICQVLIRPGHRSAGIDVTNLQKSRLNGGRVNLQPGNNKKFLPSIKWKVISCTGEIIIVQYSGNILISSNSWVWTILYVTIQVLAIFMKLSGGPGKDKNMAQIKCYRNIKIKIKGR